MDLTRAELPPDMIKTLRAIYDRLKTIEPELTEGEYFERIFKEWLAPYKKKNRIPKNKENVRLRNNLKNIIRMSGKSQTQVAKEIGINRVYLSQVINSKYEPSITLVLLLANALDYPPQKLTDLFYLEPVQGE